jgi:hypothetical protein
MNHDDGERPEVGSLTGEEVAKHNSRESCWVIVHGKAYDVTEFLPGPSSLQPLFHALLTATRAPWRSQDYPQVCWQRCD